MLQDNSDSSDEEMASFLEHHRRAMSVQRERESMARESVLRDSVLREISVGKHYIHTYIQTCPYREREREYG